MAIATKNLFFNCIIFCLISFIATQSLQGMEDNVKSALLTNIDTHQWIAIEDLIKDKNNANLLPPLFEIIKEAFFTEIEKGISLENVKALCKILTKNSKLTPQDLLHASDIIDGKIRISFGSNDYTSLQAISSFLYNIGRKTLNYPVETTTCINTASSESSSASCVSSSQVAPVAISSSSSQPSAEETMALSSISASSSQLQSIPEIPVHEEQSAQIQSSNESSTSQITEPAHQSEVITEKPNIITTPHTKQRYNCVALLWAFIMLLLPQKCG